MKFEHVQLPLYSAFWVNLDTAALGQCLCFGLRSGEGSNGDNVPWVAESPLLEAEWLFKFYCYLIHVVVKTKVERYHWQCALPNPWSCAQDVSENAPSRNDELVDERVTFGDASIRNEISWNLLGAWLQLQWSSLGQFQNNSSIKLTSRTQSQSWAPGNEREDDESRLCRTT